ncbi:XPG I 2 domain containing protein [Asbolus verrucosus]|uniref:XPG I 2 domain containing protein n=1 Tax=Asbolus verrucosus TaxID=1661398 RepID=A0A482VZR0_ASBVE|nr:XPG I 2 domain containing protein [Asbolus verrucosus]
MGVRGLTTFIANRSSQYLERHELHDCYLVVDGNSIASQLYRWHCRCNDCFGGDYDKYANVINSFVELLFDCGITPLVIFDGAYEKRKLKTVFSRMKNKLSAARDINSVTEGSVPVFPLFLREVFVDILLKLRVKCVRCDFEGDGDAAFLAKNLNCPLLSYDSDFYIFDVVYIPFSNMDLRLRKKKDVNYIACEVYKVDKFLSSFGGLDKLKIQKSKDNEQQRMIKSVIMWLKNETPESALRKILGRYKLQRRKKLADKIQLAIEGYQCVNTQICSCFNVDLNSKQENRITVPKAEEIEAVVDEDGGSEDPEQDSEEEKISENAFTHHVLWI